MSETHQTVFYFEAHNHNDDHLGGFIGTRACIVEGAELLEDWGRTSGHIIVFNCGNLTERGLALLRGRMK